MGASIGGKTAHKTCKPYQIRDAKERAALSHDEFWIRGHYICPLWRNGTNGRVVDAQQESLAVSVIPLAYTDELSPAKWMKGMRYEHKLC